MENIYKMVRLFVTGLATVAGFALVTAVFIMLLWNWLIPKLFGLPEISFWQAWGFKVLVGLLFPRIEVGDKKF